MIARASRFRIGVCRFSRLQSGVGVLAMLYAGLDTMRHVESVCKVPQAASVLRLPVPSVAVGVIFDRHTVADGVEVTR
jgi:hypothetical protein